MNCLGEGLEAILAEGDETFRKGEIAQRFALEIKVPSIIRKKASRPGFEPGLKACCAKMLRRPPGCPLPHRDKTSLMAAPSYLSLLAWRRDWATLKALRKSIIRNSGQ